jgi:uncharacterized protein (DUF2252 family)
MLRKFTHVQDGARQFIFSDRTALRPVSAAVRAEMEAAITPTEYGATLGRVGWNTKGWDDEVFRILDVGQRTGSGDGSFGLPRYYVLIAGPKDPEPTEPQPEPGLPFLAADPSLNAVILDVKMQVPTAMQGELGPEEEAWYGFLFRNEAARAIEAQRRFTSYTDPWLGWMTLFGHPYAVRERSPWKAEFPVDSLKSRERFADFAQTLAVITATSHTRASFGRSPAQIKEVIAATLGGYDAKQAWSARVAQTAITYRKQLEMDYACFREWVDSKWINRTDVPDPLGPPDPDTSDEGEDSYDSDDPWAEDGSLAAYGQPMGGAAGVLRRQER